MNRTKMNKKALIVGIDKYARLPALSGCINDAHGLAERLRRPQYGFDVEILKDAEVTRKSLRSAINVVLSNADFSLIYFAGHGLQTPVGTYLATSDSEWDDEGVELSYLVNAITHLAKGNQSVVVILDCCHAGDAPFPAAKAMPMQQSNVPALMGSGRLVMAACLGNQKAKETQGSDGLVHGRFSGILLEALDGKASDKDKNVTVSAVYEFVASELEAHGSQRPMLRGDQNGRIILGNDVAPDKNGVAQAQKAIHIKQEVVQEAAKHVSDYFDSIQQIGLRDYETTGHLEASQRLAPIIEWFERQISEDGELLGDQSFRKSWTNILQHYQQLSNITSGIVLYKSREVGDFIGSGTFGSVWKINEPQESSVCFKSYHATELRDHEKVARFDRGYRAMTQLAHPNIVTVHEKTLVPLGFYMDYIDGPNLRQYSPASSCDIEQILELLLTVGETLSHAHGRGVLHRDVKPENILLKVMEDGTLNPFLTDFDLSWFSTATKLTKVAGEGFGSHFYAAPEQMNSPGSSFVHKFSVDAYSFGQVMFFAVCGHDPAILDESGNARAFDQHLSRLAISEGVARELTSLYRNCTVRAPDKRLGDFRQICDKLSKALTLYRKPNDTLTSQEFLQELNFLIAGVISKSGDSPLYGSVTIKLPSGRTEIAIILKHENAEKLTVEATFIPAQSPVVAGASAHDSRRLINERIDVFLRKYEKDNNATRTAAKGGAYQCTVTFANIDKNAYGVSTCREIVMGVADCLERI